MSGGARVEAPRLREAGAAEERREAVFKLAGSLEEFLARLAEPADGARRLARGGCEEAWRW